MKVKLINHTPEAEALLIFTKGTRLNMVGETYEKIKERVIEDYDWAMGELSYMANTIPSSWEFINYTFMVEGVSRACTHQMVRTRNASYAQQSMRVTNQEDFDYHTGPSLENNVYHSIDYANAMTQINISYRGLIEEGVPEEDARGILPTNILTNIVASYNLRTLSDLVRSRSGGRTQSEYRDVVKAMGEEVLSVHHWADKFMYPRGVDYFDELEEAIARNGTSWAERSDLLKIIDKMRKST